MTWIDKVPSAPFTRRDIHGGDMDSVVDAVLDMAAGDPDFPRLPPARDIGTPYWMAARFRAVSLRELMRFTGPLDSVYQASLLMMAAALVPGGPLLEGVLHPRRGISLDPSRTCALFLATGRLGPSPDATADLVSSTSIPIGDCSRDGIRLVALGFLTSAVDMLSDDGTEIRGLRPSPIEALVRCVHDSNMPADHTMLAGVQTNDTAEENTQ